MRRTFRTTHEVLAFVIEVLVIVIGVPCLILILLCGMPVSFALDQLRQHRKPRLGSEIFHWLNKGMRMDYLVVDTSRFQEGLVGIRLRRCGVNNADDPPPYRDYVKFIEIKRYWVPHPLWMMFRSKKPKKKED